MISEFFELINEAYPPPSGGDSSIAYSPHSRMLKLKFWHNGGMMTYIFDEPDLSDAPKLISKIANYMLYYDNSTK